MERPHPPPKENKLLLLYAFEKIGAMTNIQATRFMIEGGLMDYLDLQLSLAELIDSGLLQMVSVDDSRYYTLTSRAQQTLSFFVSQIPASKRESIDSDAEHWRTNFQRERQLTCDYMRNSVGEYTVHLVAREFGRTLLDLKLSVPTSKQAKQLCENWEERSAAAYKILIDSLLMDSPKVEGDDGQQEPGGER